MEQFLLFSVQDSHQHIEILWRLATYWSALDFWKIPLDNIDFLFSFNLIFTACVFCKIQIRNRQKIIFIQLENQVHPTWFFKFDFSKIKCGSIAGNCCSLNPWQNYSQVSIKQASLLNYLEEIFHPEIFKFLKWKKMKILKFWNFDFFLKILKNCFEK